MKSTSNYYQPMAAGAERLLVGAASLAGKAVAAYSGLSNTAVGEVVRVASFIALGSVLMCQTNLGWWLLGMWADGVTNLVLYTQGLAK